MIAWLLVLATEQNEASLVRNKDIIDRAFPIRGDAMESLVGDAGFPWPRGRGIATIDPGRHRRRWLVRPRIDGGRTAPRYQDYRDAALSLAVTRRR